VTHVEALLLIAGMTLVTFGVRYPVLVLVRRINLPEEAFRALRYVPVAVLLAIVAPAILMPAHQLDLGLHNPYLVAGVVAVAIAAWKKRLLYTIGLGMLVFLVWRWLVIPG
jgi:branched-subunit amino acid transport protein